MSAIRDIRLLIAKHLDLPSEIRAAVLNVLNVTDAALDAEGWQEGEDIKAALRQLDAAILGMEAAEEKGEDESELIDIDDIDIFDEDDDEEGDDDEDIIFP